jgi:glycosyltransferase involved in cell wall biosynthesis
MKITAKTPQQAVQDLAIAMDNLVENRQLCEGLGEAGQQRIQQVYHWTVKAQELNQFYQNISQSETLISSQEKEISCEF